MALSLLHKDSSASSTSRPYDMKRGRPPYNSGKDYVAESYSPNFPYTGATLNGLPGTQVGNVLVPAIGDQAHEFQHPPPFAKRGPCPAMNAAANHGFIARDGIATFNELVAAQQNIWNVGYDTSVVLATVGIAWDGDITTDTLSIGGNATRRAGLSNVGLDAHDSFEGDASLTRNDFFLADGDDFSFNGTLFQMMTDTVASTSSADAPLYDLNGLALYRAQRYDQSLAQTSQFDFSPRALLLYGAASFIYEAMPSTANNFTPDKATISSFFGAVENPSSHGSGASSYSFQPERIPANWTNRATPLVLVDVVEQILKMYLLHPRTFGQNQGIGNFTPAGLEIAQNQTAEAMVCALYEMLTTTTPGSVADANKNATLAYVANKINPVFQNRGCTLVNTTAV